MNEIKISRPRSKLRNLFEMNYFYWKKLFGFANRMESNSYGSLFKHGDITLLQINYVQFVHHFVVRVLIKTMSKCYLYNLK